MHDIDRVLAFWLEPKPETEAALEERSKVWFAGGPEVDREIRERFADLNAAARRGELDGWLDTPRGSFALMIVLDQFSRNLYRGSPDSFSADAKALAIARRLIEPESLAGFDALERLFLSLPFCHAEDLEDQKTSVALVQQAARLAKPAWKKRLTTGVDFNRKHLDVIARFGRFPHRNAALGRESTPAELEYLEYLQDVGQWL